MWGRHDAYSEYTPQAVGKVSKNLGLKVPAIASKHRTVSVRTLTKR